MTSKTSQNKMDVLNMHIYHVSLYDVVDFVYVNLLLYEKSFHRMLT